jgi:hypothetical protein
MVNNSSIPTGTLTRDPQLNEFMKKGGYWLDDVSDDHVVTVYKDQKVIARFGSGALTTEMLKIILDADNGAGAL